MDAYHITLFVHLSAVIAAGAAASLAFFTGGRYARAATHADAHAWLQLNGKVLRVFPIVLIVLLLTGSYMVSLGGGAYWTTGWVRTGVGAIVVIFAIGAFAGVRHKGLERRLDEMTNAQQHARSFRAPGDPLMAVIPWLNTCLAFGMVLVMTTKPALANALTIEAVFAAAGTLLGFRTIARAKAMAGAMPIIE